MAVSEAAENTVRECGKIVKKPARSRLYRFHCVGGGDAVFDMDGRRLASIREVRQHADRVALDLMAGARCRDWTIWSVDVRDAAGRSVLTRAFTSVKVAGGQDQRTGETPWR